MGTFRSLLGPTMGIAIGTFNDLLFGRKPTVPIYLNIY